MAVRTLRFAFGLGLLVGCASSALGQSITNAGKEFVVGFLPNYGGANAIQLHLTAAEDTQVTVNYPVNAPSFETTVDVTAGDVTIVNLPVAAVSGWTNNAIANNAVLAFSSTEDSFVCYMINIRTATSDAGLALPLAALNCEYIVTTYSSSDAEYVVVAAYDDTDVTNSPPGGSDVEITLNRGQGYMGVPVRLKDPKVEQIPPTSLQGSDDDATYGHKGKGSQAPVAETCEPENEMQMVTHVSTEGAHQSDQHAPLPVIDDLEQKDCKPDTNYGRDQHIVDAAQRSVDLVSPSCSLKPEADEGDFILDDFMFSSDGQRIEHCPMEHEPGEQEACGKDRRYTRMDAKRCGRCSWPGHCPARRSDRATTVTFRWSPSAGATSARRHRERTKEFKEDYRLCSGSEATNSEYKRAYGGGRLRVRGSPAVTRTVKFKFMALNIRRWTKPARETQDQAA